MTTPPGSSGTLVLPERILYCPAACGAGHALNGNLPMGGIPFDFAASQKECRKSSGKRVSKRQRVPQRTTAVAIGTVG